MTSLVLFSAASTLLFSESAAGAEHRVRPGASIQAAIDKAAPGDVVVVEPGEYHQSVYIDKPKITLRGLRKGDAWAVLDGKSVLNDGIISSGHSTVIQGFHVKAYKGNGIMTQGANNFSILDNRVEGAFYAIFPQFGKNGLVKGNTVTGAEDAGIYVGMSDHVDVVDNVAHHNVMGIELENTRHGLLARNRVYENSTGIALTVVPGLPVKDATDLVVRDNRIENNNLKNFAPSSSIAAMIPNGLGIVVFGPDRVTIENNQIIGHDNIGIMTSDLGVFGLATDPRVDPYSDAIRIHANAFSGNGENMQGMLAGMVKPTGRTGFEVVSMGKGRESCIVPAEGVDALGTEKWPACPASTSKASFASARVPGGAKEPVYTAEQRGRLTYLAVCTGCHTYDSVLHGPSMQSIQVLYAGNPEGLAAYVRAPVKKREGFPEMPPQAYLGEETLAAISDYVLNSLGRE